MPWDMRAWQERLERLSSPHADAWAPAIDVYETPDSYVVTAEVPGLKREDVDLALEETRLTLRGQRVDRRTSSDVLHFHQVERSHGSFSRTFEFGEKVDMDRVSADLTDGVLTVTLPKIAPPPARRIEVT
jgi:HSP20 family protein